MSGRVVTFYSYKGGVGRSMALANIAMRLARLGRRVLCVDWDLEAPGLHHYFRSRLPPGWRADRGVLDLVERHDLAWTDLVGDAMHGVDPPPTGRIDLLSSGRDAADFVSRLQALDWDEAYASGGLLEHLERLRSEWIEAYDFVFVDSRTGLADIAGICTIQLPDILLMFLTANAQSLEGTLDVAARIHRGREAFAVPRARVPIVPIVTQWPVNEEVDLAAEWFGKLAISLAPVYADWLHAGVTPTEILRYTLIPRVARWSFVESLPIETEDARNIFSISYAYESLAALVDRQLAGTDRFVAERDAYLRELSTAVAATEGAPYVLCVGCRVPPTAASPALSDLA